MPLYWDAIVLRTEELYVGGGVDGGGGDDPKIIIMLV